MKPSPSLPAVPAPALGGAVGALALVLALAFGATGQDENCAQNRSPVTSGPVRILFLGHEAEHHPSDAYYPMIA